LTAAYAMHNGLLGITIVLRAAKNPGQSEICSGKITEKASWTEQFPANLLTGAKHLQPSQPIT